MKKLLLVVFTDRNLIKMLGLEWKEYPYADEFLPGVMCTQVQEWAGGLLELVPDEERENPPLAPAVKSVYVHPSAVVCIAAGTEMQKFGFQSA